jgi:hypothetical protein
MESNLASENISRGADEVAIVAIVAEYVYI